MYNRSEGFFKAYDDTRLFFQIWANPQAKGTIIINHGQGEHSDSYQRLVDYFKNDSWTFYAWDMRGHGRSDGKRGFVEKFDDYCHDYESFVEKVLADQKRPAGPVILLCHSMGGLVQLKSLVKNPSWISKIAGQVLSAPLLGLALPVPKFKSEGARLLNQILPTVTLYNEIKNEMLTRDLDVIREFEQDSLRHNRISSGAFLGILSTYNEVQTQAAKISMPTLLVVAEIDPIVSTPAARTFYTHLASTRKEIYVYPNAKHELINDTVRSTVFQDIKKYLDSFLGAL